ncbi:MAG: hypothetical protein J6O41_02775 [Clostridia bacterium]|nr:hypothetical protein [Clostridia bacterium]
MRIAQLDVLTDTNEITGFGLGALVKDSRINHGKDILKFKHYMCIIKLERFV